MSLVMAIRCGDSAVVLADSQETYGDYKTVVEKISPIRAGNLEIAFAAASNSADLVDSLTDLLARRLKGSVADSDDSVRADISAVLAAFHASDEFALYPADEPNKRIVGTFCVRLIAQRTVLLFRSAATTLTPIPTYSLMGFDHELYDVTAKRLFTPALKLAQAIWLGLHVFTLAKKTCTAIGGPIRVLVASPNRMILEPEGAVAQMEAWVDGCAVAMDRLLLAAPNPTCPTAAFRQELLALQGQLFRLRLESTRAATTRASAEAKADSEGGDTDTLMRLLPPRSVIPFSLPPHDLAGFENVVPGELMRWLMRTDTVPPCG